MARNPIQFRQVQEQTMELIDQTDKNVKIESDKLQSYSSDIDLIDKKISDVKLSSAGSKDIQTFKFVADEFHVDLNTVARWFILVLIFVFDPLAVALILAYNIAIHKKDEVPLIEQKPIIPTPIVTPVELPIFDEVKPVEIEKKVVIDEPIPTLTPIVEEIKSVESVIPPIENKHVGSDKMRIITGAHVHN